MSKQSFIMAVTLAWLLFCLLLVGYMNKERLADLNLQIQLIVLMVVGGAFLITIHCISRKSLFHKEQSSEADKQ
jgi:hypothetical protein